MFKKILPNFFLVVAPAARELHGRFAAFYARVHGEHAIKAKVFGDELGVGAELVTGVPGRVIFKLKKCSLLALELRGTQWTVRWQLAPELFGA